MNTVNRIEVGLPRLVVVERTAVSVAIAALGIWQAIQNMLSLDVPAGNAGSEMWITNVDVKTDGEKVLHQSYVECWIGEKPIEAHIKDGSVSILIKNSKGELEGVLFKSSVPSEVCINAQHPQGADGAFVQVFQGFGNIGK